MTARFSFSMAINEREKKEKIIGGAAAVPKQFIINDINIIKTSEGAFFLYPGREKFSIFHSSC